MVLRRSGRRRSEWANYTTKGSNTTLCLKLAHRQARVIHDVSAMSAMCPVSAALFIADHAPVDFLALERFVM